MIPEFPQFKNLELSDQKDIEKFTSEFPHYSDFNFMSMWCWDIHSKVKLSQLNHNLIVQFCDYVTDEEFLSFLGNHKVIETVSELISFSINKYHKNFLKLIPEEAFLGLKTSNFIIKTERDSFDYVYLVEHLATMNSWTQNTSAKRIRQFLKTQHNYVVEHSTLNEISSEKHHDMFRKWSESKNIADHFELNEYKAFKRLFEVKDKNLRLVSLYENEILIGFTIYETISNNYAISHFAKADKRHHAAIYDLLNWEEAKYLHSLGIKYFNWEQDLGLPSLRYSKTKYRPAFFLKKLLVQQNDDQLL